jgi:hypothetical protein
VLFVLLCVVGIHSNWLIDTDSDVAADKADWPNLGNVSAYAKFVFMQAVVGHNIIFLC